MVQGEREQLIEKLQEFVEKKGSLSKASKVLKGGSTATLSKIKNNKTEDISTELLRSLVAQTNRGADGWKIVPTRAYKRMTALLSSCQDDSLVMAITGDAGCGKSEAIRQYADVHSNVILVSCSEYYNRGSFMRLLLKAVGIETSGSSVADMMDDVVDALTRRDHPLIILDEADKLTDQVLYFFITIYNRLEWRCGIVLTATSHLEKKLSKGLRLGRRGYSEIWSRIGRRCIPLQVINEDDIAEICIANGVDDDKAIEAIAKDSEYDLRRVKRAVWAYHKKGAK